MGDSRRRFNIGRVHEQQWLEDHGPCVRCGSAEDMRVVWTKEGNPPHWPYAIFRWLDPQRRADALAEFEILCRSCWRKTRITRRHGEGVQGIRGCKCEPCMDLNRRYSANRRQMKKDRAQRVKELTGNA